MVQFECLWDPPLCKSPIFREDLGSSAEILLARPVNESSSANGSSLVCPRFSVSFIFPSYINFSKILSRVVPYKKPIFLGSNP